MDRETYVLVTAARNEAAYIEKTIEAVLGQTRRPLRWVIVSDGSDDGTDEIVSAYASGHPEILFMRRESSGVRGVESKVEALRSACSHLPDQYDYWGNLDADVTFEPDYFERLLERFRSEPRLGIAGGLVWEKVGGRFEPQLMSEGGVAGAVQLFRRECFEAVGGGYLPMPHGGEDAAAEIMARAAGWEVKTIRSLPVLHHRRVGGGTGRVLVSRFRQGRMDRSLGYHPLFEGAKCVFRTLERPYFLGSLFRAAGYLWAMLRREPILLPEEAAAYVRAEQLKRLWGRGSENVRNVHEEKGPERIPHEESTNASGQGPERRRP